MLVKTNDNSGIKTGQTINYQLILNLFGQALTSLKQLKPGKLKKGDLHLTVITGRRQWALRRSGINSRLSSNQISLVKKDHTPIGTRFYGCVYLESRVTGYMRLAVLSRKLL